MVIDHASGEHDPAPLYEKRCESGVVIDSAIRSMRHIDERIGCIFFVQGVY